MKEAKVLFVEDGFVGLGYMPVDYPTLHDVLGGYVELVSPVSDEFGDWHAYVNEEGKVNGMVPNLTGSMLAEALGHKGGDLLFGPVLFLGSDPDDPSEEGDLPDEALAQVEVVLGALGYQHHEVEVSQ